MTASFTEGETCRERVNPKSIVRCIVKHAKGKLPQTLQRIIHTRASSRVHNRIVHGLRLFVGDVTGWRG